MKYKVGDKVRVRKDLNESTYYGGYGMYSEMLDKVGCVATIEKLLSDCYRINECGYMWTDEMFEGLAEDELTVEEAIRIQAEICSSISDCANCPIYKEKGGYSCESFKAENPEKVVEIIKQWKKDHEKKEVEVEFVDVIRIIEDTGDIMRCVHEERIDVEFVKISADIKRVLKDWCKDHDGEFFAVLESRCVVKE